jgi:hypothetical protein
VGYLVGCTVRPHFVLAFLAFSCARPVRACFGRCVFNCVWVVRVCFGRLRVCSLVSLVCFLGLRGFRACHFCRWVPTFLCPPPVKLTSVLHECLHACARACVVGCAYLFVSCWSHPTPLWDCMGTRLSPNGGLSSTCEHGALGAGILVQVSWRRGF